VTIVSVTVRRAWFAAAATRLADVVRKAAAHHRLKGAAILTAWPVADVLRSIRQHQQSTPLDAARQLMLYAHWLLVESSTTDEQLTTVVCVLCASMRVAAATSPCVNRLPIRVLHTLVERMSKSTPRALVAALHDVAVTLDAMAALKIGDALSRQDWRAWLRALGDDTTTTEAVKCARAAFVPDVDGRAVDDECAWFAHSVTSISRDYIERLSEVVAAGEATIPNKGLRA